MAHLTKEQRYVISCLLAKGKTQKEIADVISKNKSVVSREIKRNKDQRNGIYKDDLANRKYATRQQEKPKYRRFTSEIKQYVDILVAEDYSPEQIVGVSKDCGIDCVSHERIYQHIWLDKKNNGELHTHLRRKGRRYRKRGNKKDSRGIIKNRVIIDSRPKIVERRERFGDLEVDLIIGKNHNQAILTVNDRASGMLKMRKVKSKESEVVTNAIVGILGDWIPYIHTITADNGKEFAGHETVTELLNIDYYFAHPYHSWERGSNENLNGLVRQFFPKGSDFTKISDNDILRVQEKLNNRPRKRFGFKSPIFVMNKLLFNQKVAFVT
jgi:IS30 family transposase